MVDLMRRPSLAKNYSGTFSGGQGPVLGMEKSGESEPHGPYGGEGKRITKVTSPDHDSADGREEKGFELDAKDYAGPDNWKPVDIGTRNPDDVEGQSKQWLNKGR